jgi:hypothetical protein
LEWEGSMSSVMDTADSSDLLNMCIAYRLK